MKEYKPLVSAVIPVYNGEKFLAETIESVLSQTYPNIECIVVNDGSTDRTQEVAKSFGSNIRYFEKPNGGVSSARNFGIAKSKGEFIAFLDADDLWLPTKIEKQIALIKASIESNENAKEIGLVYTGSKIVNESKVEMGERHVAETDRLIENVLLLKPDIGGIATTGLVKKSVFAKVGGFDERLSTSADGDFLFRVALCFGVAAIPEALALYRHHDGQMHLNLEAFEHDMKIICEKLFTRDDLPRNVIAIRSECRSAVNITLSVGYLRSQGKYAKSMGYFVKAMWSDPVYTIGRLGEIARSYQEKKRLAKAPA